MATASTKDTARMMVIDGQKLKHELKARGLKQSEASRELGLADSYISYSITRNIITRQTAKALEAFYNIKTDDIRPDVKAEPTESVKETAEDSNQELYDTIFRAVKDAFVWYANNGRSAT